MNRAQPNSEATPVNRPPGQAKAAQLDRCIDASERLLGILRLEAKALRNFDKEWLLELIAEKEAVANQLAGRMKTAEPSSKTFARVNGQDHSQLPGSTADAEEWGREEHAKRILLRKLLAEVNGCNQRNQVFILNSLSYWQDLLNLCLPSTYSPGYKGQAAMQAIRVKGVALHREI